MRLGFLSSGSEPRAAGSGLAVLLALALGSAGCNIDPYCLTCGDDDGGAVDSGADSGPEPDAEADASPLDACIGQAETCNGRDDDCDGFIDEGNPGGGAVCSRNVGECREGTTMCSSGRLECMGGVVARAEECNGRDDDCDGTDDNGDPGGGLPCGSGIGECMRGTQRCVGGSLMCQGGIGPMTETCNGRDDDCDMMVDDNVPSSGTCGTDQGECSFGQLVCIGGGFTCQNAVGPRVERCDTLDNDCDMGIDEDFDLQNDARNCGACGNVCGVPNAMGALWRCTPGVTTGSCEVRGCQGGFYDVNMNPADGCEYECDFLGEEICNGMDDDCDRLIDGADSDLRPPPANFCRSVGPCAGATVTCDSTLGRFRCMYGANVETDAMGNLIAETRCDDIDNDCDGVTDTDSFPLKGQDCGNGVGACRSSGRLECAPGGTTLRCNAPPALPAGTEICDGADNDCDGAVDETKVAPGMNASYVVEPMIQVGAAYVYQYEAARPDASAATAGTLNTRACARSGVLPWTDITYAEAVQACTSAGLRLCNETEWTAACRGTTPCAWGMMSCSTYSATQCNGEDFPGSQPDSDALRTTGSLAACAAPGPIFDLSGNVKEWTQARSPGVNPLRGGAYDTTQLGMRCDFDFTVAGDTYRFPDTGFRCCSSTPP